MFRFKEQKENILEEYLKIYSKNEENIDKEGAISFFYKIFEIYGKETINENNKIPDDVISDQTLNKSVMHHYIFSLFENNIEEHKLKAITYFDNNILLGFYLCTYYVTDFEIDFDEQLLPNQTHFLTLKKLLKENAYTKEEHISKLKKDIEIYKNEYIDSIIKNFNIKQTIFDIGYEYCNSYRYLLYYFMMAASKIYFEQEDEDLKSLAAIKYYV